MTRDPEITNLISTSDDDLFFELSQEKAEEKRKELMQREGKLRGTVVEAPRFAPVAKVEQVPPPHVEPKKMEEIK